MKSTLEVMRVSDYLRIHFRVDDRVWTYDAVTNRIGRNKVTSHSLPSSNACFRVEKMLFRASKKQYFDELDSCMTHLLLEITQECTLRCSYCIYSGNYKGERTHSKQYMDLQTAMDAVSFFEKHSRNTVKPVISFYGGEALLQFDTIRQVVAQSMRLFRGRKLVFRIATNGTTLSDDVCQWLREHPCVMADVTLNGYSHDRYRRFKNGEGSLFVIENHLSNLRLHYPDVFDQQIHFICNYADAVELTEIIRYYQEHDIVPSLITGITRDGGNEVIQTLGVSEQENIQAWDELKQSYCQSHTPHTRAVFDSSMLRIHRRSATVLKENVEIEQCCFPFMTNCYVDVYGQITLCEKMPGTERFGDIQSGVNKTKVEQLMENYANLRNIYCKDCWAQRLCTRCFADIHNVSHFTDVCNSIKKEIVDDLIMYCHIYEKEPELFASFSEIVLHSERLDGSVAE